MPSSKCKRNDGIRKPLIDVNANISSQKFNEEQDTYLFSKLLPKLPLTQRKHQELHSEEPGRRW